MDWGSIGTTAKAEMISEGIKALIGERPKVTYYADHARISFPPKAQVKARAYLEKQIRAAGKATGGDIRIDAMPVVLPVVAKQAAPYLIGAMVAGYLLGRL
jgi:hypothetical protein